MRAPKGLARKHVLVPGHVLEAFGVADCPGRHHVRLDFSEIAFFGPRVSRRESVRTVAHWILLYTLTQTQMPNDRVASARWRKTVRMG